MDGRGRTDHFRSSLLLHNNTVEQLGSPLLTSQQQHFGSNINLNNNQILSCHISSSSKTDCGGHQLGCCDSSGSQASSCCGSSSSHDSCFAFYEEPEEFFSDIRLESSDLYTDLSGLDSFTASLTALDQAAMAYSLPSAS